LIVTAEFVCKYFEFHCRYDAPLPNFPPPDDLHFFSGRISGRVSLAA